MATHSSILDGEMMLKAQPLCTGAEMNLGDKVWGEVEKNSFIALPGKGVQWLSLSLLVQGIQVRSLVEVLRSHMPPGQKVKQR